MEIFLQKDCKNSRVHKIGAAISGPRTAGKNVYSHEAFSDITYLIILLIVV